MSRSHVEDGGGDVEPAGYLGDAFVPDGISREIKSAFDAALFRRDDETYNGAASGLASIGAVTRRGCRNQEGPSVRGFDFDGLPGTKPIAFPPSRVAPSAVVSTCFACDSIFLPA